MNCLSGLRVLEPAHSSKPGKKNLQIRDVMDFSGEWDILLRDGDNLAALYF